jgi:hypothetical protein
VFPFVIPVAMQASRSGIHFAVGVQRSRPEAGSPDKPATSMWLALRAIGFVDVRFDTLSLQPGSVSR